MKLVFVLTLLFSLSSFAQNAEALKKAVIEQHEAMIVKIKKAAGKNALSPEQKVEVSRIESLISIFKTIEPGIGGYVGGMGSGGYVGGIGSGGGIYPSNSLWDCQLSHDEKEIACASGKKYKLTSDGDETERSIIYKEQWIPNVPEVKKTKVKQQ